MGAIKTALKKIESTLMDFSSLTVATYSGNLSVIVKEAQGSGDSKTPLGNLDFNKLYQYAISESATKAEGKVTLVALNVHKVDGDSIVYRDPQISDDLEAAHNAAVTAGRETREGILNLVKSAL